MFKNNVVFIYANKLSTILYPFKLFLVQHFVSSKLCLINSFERIKSLHLNT